MVGLACTGRAINLVGTRVIDARHADLQRWYSDHAMLLLRAPQLQDATLLQRLDGADAPDYLCLYTFADMADFLRFDHGAEMAEVRRLSQQAFGRDSVDMVERNQFERWLTRSWALTPGDGERMVHAQRVRLDHAPPNETLRWLNDRLQSLSTRLPLRSARLYGAPASALFTDIFVLLEVCGRQPLPRNWWSPQDSGGEAPMGLRPIHACRGADPGPGWSAIYRVWGRWGR